MSGPENPIEVEAIRQDLEIIGIGFCADHERSIATPGSLVGDTLNRLVLAGDAYSQAASVPGDKDPATAGWQWAESALGFIEQGIRRGWISRDMARLSILSPDSRQMQIHTWQIAREEAFARNPQYHGSRYGIDYARVVAAGQLT